VKGREGENAVEKEGLCLGHLWDVDEPEACGGGG
jgi:hypothetical protein